MEISYQLKYFIIYILVGNILGIIFDFFRAFRINKKTKKNYLLIQDIIYFLIVTVILIFTNIFILKDTIRFYFLLGLLIGIAIYVNMFSKIILKNWIMLFKLNSSIISFILLPINIFIQNFVKIYKFFYKIIQKCCKKIRNMITYIISMFNINNKKRFENENKKK